MSPGEFRKANTVHVPVGLALFIMANLIRCRLSAARRRTHRRRRIPRRVPQLRLAVHAVLVLVYLGPYAPLAKPR